MMRGRRVLAAALFCLVAVPLQSQQKQPSLATQVAGLVSDGLDLEQPVQRTVDELSGELRRDIRRHACAAVAASGRLGTGWAWVSS